MDKGEILKKLAYQTTLAPKTTDNDLLMMLGFNKSVSPTLLEKINYPTSLTLPSFEEELKKMVEINSQRGLKKKQI